MYRTALAALLTLLIPVALAGVYKTVDEHGNITYSDRPKDDSAEAIEVREVQSSGTGGQKLGGYRYTDKDPWEDQEESFVYETFAISSPQHEHTFHNPEYVIVNIKISPALAKAHNLRLNINGKPAAKPGKQTNFSLQLQNRGQYTLTAEILDESKNVVERSEPVIFYIQRTSIILNPG